MATVRKPTSRGSSSGKKTKARPLVKAKVGTKKIARKASPSKVAPKKRAVVPKKAPVKTKTRNKPTIAVKKNIKSKKAVNEKSSSKKPISKLKSAAKPTPVKKTSRPSTVIAKPQKVSASTIKGKVKVEAKADAKMPAPRKKPSVAKKPTVSNAAKTSAHAPVPTPSKATAKKHQQPISSSSKKREHSSSLIQKNLEIREEKFKPTIHTASTPPAFAIEPAPKGSTPHSAQLALLGISPYMTLPDESYMNEKQRQHFVNILNRWRQLLMEEADRTVTQMKEEPANYADPNDRASLEEEFSIELRARDRERKLIRKIEKTLELIKKDEYGYCDICGIEIGIRRLEARPTATLCIDCKTLDEIKEKQVSGG